MSEKPITKSEVDAQCVARQDDLEALQERVRALEGLVVLLGRQVARHVFPPGSDAADEIIRSLGSAGLIE